MSDDKIPISEIFGPTIQGEGQQIGRPTVFIRTGGCDYRCSWCDTLYAVLPEHAKQWKRLAPATVCADVRALARKPVLITLSGGNPAMWDGLEAVIDQLHGELYDFTMETQGSIWKPWMSKLDYLTLSPKPPSAKIHFDQPLFETIVRMAPPAPRTSIKVVVMNDTDLAFAYRLRDLLPDHPFFVSVGNPGPGATTVEQLLHRTRWLAEVVADRDRRYDITVLPQLHALIWPNSRGV